MKFTIVCLFATVTVALGQLYTDKYDGINYHDVLGNSRLLKSYIQCMLDDTNGRCTVEGKELKTHLPDALQTGCSKCTPKQKEGTDIVIAHLINKNPEDWAKLTAKFDPTGKYAKKYEKEYKKITA